MSKITLLKTVFLGNGRIQKSAFCFNINIRKLINTQRKLLLKMNKIHKKKKIMFLISIGIKFC